MKIVSLRAENFKKLIAIDLTPDGNIVQISGKNGAGKSSVLDAIESALVGGGKGELRKGTEKGKVILDLGSFTITRTFSGENQYLKVATKDGFEKKSPQKFLDELMGTISFDPLNFANADSKKQRQILLEFTGLDLDEIEARKKAIELDRTVNNKILKEKQNVLGSMPVIENVLQPVVVTDLLAKLDAIAADRNKIYEGERTVRNEINGLDICDAQILDLQDKIALLQQEIADRQVWIENNETRIKETQSNKAIKEEAFLNAQKAHNELVISLGDLDAKELETREQIKNAEQVNKSIQDNEKRNLVVKEIIDLEITSEELSKKLLAIETEKTTEISKAPLPIEGLGFIENGITYTGISFGSLSSAEKIRVSVAVSMALNPKIKVLRITDGSLLDSESMQMITNMAQEKDYQIWIERVDETGEVGFYIEDGSLKNQIKMEGIE